jgi:hypothetical protein
MGATAMSVACGNIRRCGRSAVAPIGRSYNGGMLSGSPSTSSIAITIASSRPSCAG